MKKKITLSLVAALSLTTLNAYEMKPVGFKAMGMGGTGVASTRGSLSGYYNPALLRFSDYTAEFGINVGVRVRESNLIKPMDELSDIDFDGTLDRIGKNTDKGKKIYEITLGGVTQAVDTTGTGKNNLQSDRDSLTSAIEILTQDIGTNNAFQLSVTPSFTAQMSDALAIGVYANIDAMFRINIDSNYNRLITKNTETVTVGGQTEEIDMYFEYNPTTDYYTGTNNDTAYKTSSLEYANNNDINYIEVDTMALVETPISYAKAYDWDSGTWSFGVNLKPMALITSSQKVSLGESSDEADDDSDTYETTYKPTLGLDLGLAYRPTDSKVTLGLIGKNINSPTFKVDVPATGQIVEDYKIDPLFRAGLSVPIWNDNIEFALDVDLQKNDTLIEGEQSQFVGAGIELHPASWFAFRVGAMQDIASEKFDDGTIVTAGLGFGLKWAQLDLSVMMGTNTGEYDGAEIPKYAAVNLALVSRWGDGYNSKQPPVEENTNNTSMTDTNDNSTISTQEKDRIQTDANKAYKDLDKEIQ